MAVSKKTTKTRVRKVANARIVKGKETDLVWVTALELAEGDASRLRWINKTTVVVRNP